MLETAAPEPPEAEPAMAPGEGLDGLLRLAARLFDTPAAALRATDPDGTPARADLGLSPEESGLATALCVRAAEGPRGVQAGPAPGFAFAATAPIRASDGVVLGALAVMDRTPRPSPGEEAERGLIELAALAATTLDARRHRLAELGEARWAALWDRLKALAVEAPDYETAAAATTRALCEAAGGLLCTLHRLGAERRHFQLVAGFAEEAIGGAARIAAIRAAPPGIEDRVLGAAIEEGHAVFAADAGALDPRRHRLLAATEVGPVVLGAMPLFIGEEQCVLLLCCPAPGPDLALLLREAAATLRPLLQMLRDEERMLLHRRIVEGSSEAVLVTEATPEEARIVQLNPAFEALTGFTAAELVGRTPRLLQGLGAPGEGWRAIREAVRRQQALRQTVSFRRKDGTPIWVDLHIAPITDASGRCTHFVSMLRDVTREREATARLAESEAAFRSLFERNPIPMYIYDRETLRFLSVNHAMVQEYGWSRDAFLEKSILDIRPAEDRAAVQAAAARPRGERNASGPWRHLTAEGQEKMVRIVSHLTEFAGRPAALVAVLDITARLRFEEDLRRSRQALQRQAVELRRTQRLARLGTWRWLAGGQRVAWSEELHAIFGTDPEGPAPTREQMLALVHPEDRAPVEEAIARIAGTGRAAAFEFRVLRPDGRTLHCRAEGDWEADLESEQGAVHGYIQDVTEQREAEAALRQSDRMASLGQLTGGIAHDFNNLLTVASVSLEMAAEAAREGEASPELIESARAALERGMRLTSQLLSYARKQPLRPQPLDLGRVLPALLDLMRRSLGERYTLTLEAGSTAPVLADPAGLEAALMNLLVNARDAMPLGGPITVMTRRLSVGPGTVGLAAELAPGDYAMIAISDRGTGMPPEVRARIFEPFFTTKPTGRGTGLGLSMVLGFAKQSGGHVAVYSEPGQGTTMQLFLPVAAADEAVAAAEEAAPDLPTGLDVLVVEDQPDVREAAIRLCREVGLEPLAVGNAAEAVGVLRSGLRFDLLFTDVVLGGEMDGIELAGLALALQPGIAVVCTSGYTESQVSERGQLAAGMELLTKPYDMRRFRIAAGRAFAAARGAG
jgi:PAS domain S-box-containing protein